MTKLNTKKADATNVAEAKESEVNVAITSLYTSTKAITNAINLNVKVATNVQHEYQKIACSVIQHLAAHKDIRIVRHLLDTMPESQRKKSMSAFFDRFASVAFTEDTDTGKPVINYDATKPTNLAHALTFPWWKASVESAYVPFDLQRELAKLMQRAENKLKKGVSTEKGDNVTVEQVAAISQLIVAMAPNALVNAA